MRIIENEDRIIETISLEFPMGQNGENISYSIGEKGVTEIRLATKNGEMATVQYFEIYRGDTLSEELHHYSWIKYKAKE